MAPHSLMTLKVERQVFDRTLGVWVTAEFEVTVDVSKLLNVGLTVIYNSRTGRSSRLHGAVVIKRA